MENNAQDHVLEKILHCLQAMQSSEREVWDAEDIAYYTKLKRKTVQNGILTDPSFPSPGILPTGGRRWNAKEVRAWWHKRKSAK